MFPKPIFKRRKPKRKERGQVTPQEAQNAFDWFGNECTICGATPVELHHVTFKSQGGRGGYRNLMPLCKKHHDKAHRDRGFADSLRQERIEMFGKYFSCDRFDLFEHGHIEDPNEEAFENYMNGKGEK